MLHRKTTSAGLNLIKSFEGFSPVPYICPAGYNTIAYGHVILHGEMFTSVTMAMGEELLSKDLFKAERSVLRLIAVPLTDCQFDALVSFVFNLGGGALQCSTLKRMLNRGDDIEEVAKQFERWVYSGGKKLKGLVLRRQAEAEMFVAYEMRLQKAA